MTVSLHGSSLYRVVPDLTVVPAIARRVRHRLTGASRACCSVPQLRGQVLSGGLQVRRVRSGGCPLCEDLSWRLAAGAPVSRAGSRHLSRPIRRPAERSSDAAVTGRSGESTDPTPAAAAAAVAGRHNTRQQ